MSLFVALGAACGLALIASGVPLLSGRKLASRVGPYLRGLHGHPSRFLHAPSGTWATRIESVAERYRPGSSDRLSERLAGAGDDRSPAAFRLEQIAWGLASLIASWALVIGITGPTASAVPGILVLGVISGITGSLARDWWLSRRVSDRLEGIKGELPTALDLITLSIMSGESVPSAFARVAAIMPGSVGDELRRTVADIRAGSPLTEALDGLKRRVPDHSMMRLVDSVITGVEKGAPLAEVLRQQAADLREDKRRRLLELGGRREVLMLLPVVFLIMPVVVVFALWPGLVSLDLLVP